MKLPKFDNKKLLIIPITIVVYAVLKLYVLSTPSPDDDSFPEKIRDGMLMLVDVDSDDDEIA